MNFLKPTISGWINRVTRISISRYRQVTGRYRQLPDFIIIGAQKSGTTSLYYYLSQHPQLKPSYGKEIHFFDGGLNPKVDNFKKGQVWYQAHFPLKRNMNAHEKAFEASPLYIFNPLTPKRISELIPQVRLIAILRNPVERAISHYFHEKGRGLETLSIMEALQVEEERLKPSIDKQDYKNTTFMNFSYKNRGIYHEQLKRYFNYFPRQNILVIDSETFFAQPDHTLRRVFKFVGVEPEFTVNDLAPQNMSSNKTEVDANVYEYLKDYFQSHNQALYDLIGQNFGW